jgi:hypothetical protein
MNLRLKLPSSTQTAQVFAVTCLVIYGWTTYRFLETLPSWLYYLRFGEILSNYAYTAVIDFIEALLFIGAILLINLLLPRRLFFDRFVARGSLLSIFVAAYLIYLALRVGASKAFQFPEALFVWAPVVFALLVIAAVLLALWEPVRRVMEDFADRALILLYVLLPLTALGFVVLVFNLIF